MISAQRRMLTLFCVTFVLATLMTISHYGGPTIRTANGRRLILNEVDHEKLVEILNSVPFQSSSLSDSTNDNDESINNNNNNQINNFQPSPLPANVLVQQKQLPSQFSIKPLLSSLSSPNLVSSPLSHSSVIQLSNNFPLPSSTLNLPSSSSSSSSSSPLPPSLSPSNQPLQQSSPLSPALSVITTKNSPSPVNNIPLNSISEFAQLTAMARNESKNVTEEKFRGYFKDEEIQLTRQFLIDKPNFCDTDNGASLDLLILVNSAVKNFEARQAIRETWGKFAVERGSLLLFHVGDSVDPFISDLVRKENDHYSDILQGAFIDSYYNLTLKTMSMMKWVSDNCDKVKFVLKVDDDMFINMQLLVDFCETRNFTKSIIGHIGKKWKPHRDIGSKWFVSHSVFNRTYFPNFATGPCYMFSGDAARPLSEQSYKMKPLHLEDVFMTGIVAEAAKIRRLNYSLIKNVRVKVTPCNFKRFITSHKHTPQEIVTLWNQVYDEMDKPCEKPTIKPAAGVPKPQAKKPSSTVPKKT